MSRKGVLKHATEGKRERRIEGKVRRERRCQEILDTIRKRQDTVSKQETLDRAMWRTCFGRGYGPVL